MRGWGRLRLPVGVAAGIATAAVELLFLAVAGVAHTVSALAPGRRVTDQTRRYAGRLVRMERHRLGRLLDAGELPHPRCRDPATGRLPGCPAATRHTRPPGVRRARRRRRPGRDRAARGGAR
ncbi:hypothetical protein NKG94_13675 [Micromonospora sp. M12]